MEGVRFFDALLRHLLNSTALRGKRFTKTFGSHTSLDASLHEYEIFIERLMDPNMKRILFDARQAQVFDDMAEEIPLNMLPKIHAPFDKMYIEFTEPLALETQEPGQFDYARAFMFQRNIATADIPLPDRPEPVRTDLSALTLFLSSHKPGETEGTYVDRSWMFSLESGIGFTRAGTARGTLSRGTYPDPSEVPESWSDYSYVAAGFPIFGVPDRHIGWWETAIQSYTSLFMWMLAYMMCKSIIIVEAPMSRAERRNFTRQGQMPRPWHVVKVEPKFYEGRPEGEGTGSQHSYRYDVIGHLRFGKHKTRDGYVDTIEWVPPHQRGLANTLYIPKTYKVEGEKIVSPRMKEYFS